MSPMKKHVVITGAGSGLGAALAYKYNKQGYFVTLIGRTKVKLEQVAETFGNSAYAIYPLDVSSFHEVEKVFQQIIYLALFALGIHKLNCHINYSIISLLLA